MYRAGTIGGTYMGALSKLVGAKYFDQSSVGNSFDSGLIEIKNPRVKKVLGLDRKGNSFPWYTVLGLSKNSTKHQAAQQFIKLNFEHGADNETLDVLIDAHELSKELGK